MDIKEKGKGGIFLYSNRLDPNFGGDIICVEEKVEVRMLKDVKEVLFDRKWAEEANDFELYFMYRGLAYKEDIRGRFLRYDITIIPFQMLGKEYPKTKGHYHPDGYGEIYTVLEGKAIYLLQNEDATEVVAIEADKGQIVIVPPGYGHITINPGKEILKMANWISPSLDSDYDSIMDKGGGAYFLTTDGWIKNKNYGKVPKLRFLKARDRIPEDIGFLFGE